MSAETLARIQFAFTIGYHFLIVPLSIGLALMVVIAEGRHYRSQLQSDKAASSFWIRLFTTTFAIGVATGITMEFAFGANWANYSRFVGDIFGAPLAAEAIFSFFLESTFLGILLFGRDRVSHRVYYVSTWLVFAGAALSALWIIIANSWQQTPRGFRIVEGKAVLTDFWAAAFNPSTAPRYVHTLVATLIAGAFLVAGISAWYLLKGRHVTFARRYLATGLIVGLVTSAAMPFIGHWHALEVAAEQPVKMAAFEGIYESGEGAELTLLGWVGSDEQGNAEARGISIPGGLSLMLGLSTDHVVKGLDQVAPRDRPPLQLTFQSYHLMIALGFYFVAIMAVALFFAWRRRIEGMRWLLWLLVVSIPLPVFASEFGWIAAEVGRQPWIVQGLLRTSEGVSPAVSTAEVAATLTIFVLLYAALFVGWLSIFLRLVRRGLGEEMDEPVKVVEPAIAEPVAEAPVSPAEA